MITKGLDIVDVLKAIDLEGFDRDRLAGETDGLD
jgi:hypothetical protein